MEAALDSCQDGVVSVLSVDQLAAYRRNVFFVSTRPSLGHSD